MLTQQIALVPEAGGVSPSELLRVSAALQKQISSQFGPAWNIQATVDAFAEIEDIPVGYWPIVLCRPERAGLAGIHLNENGQPCAGVLLTAGWSLAASRVCLEMLVNASGRRTLSAPSPRSDQGPAEILIEACGAFGALRAYAVNDVPVADFCLPAFYDSPRGAKERFSFGGSLTSSLQLQRGGHLAWFDAISNSWWLRSFHDEHPSDLSLGALRMGTQSVRELVMRHPHVRSLPAPRPEPLDARIGLAWVREQASAASRARAQHLRELLGGALAEETDELMLSTPIELKQERRSAPPPLPQRSEEPRAARASQDSVHELAFDAAAVPGAQSGARPIATAQRSEPFHEPRVEPAPDVVAPQPAAVVAEPAAMPARPAPVVAQPVTVVPGAPAHVAQQPSLQQLAKDTLPGLGEREPEAPNAHVTERAAPAFSKPLLPPPLTASTRPSSIAPTMSMLEERPAQGSRMGMILIAAAVAGLALATWLRGDATHASGAATVAPPTRPAVAAPATPLPPAEPAPVEPTPAPVVTAPAKRADKSKAPDANRSPSKAAAANIAPKASAVGSSESLAAKTDGAEKRRRRERVYAPAGLEPAAPATKPDGAIENLFDTRK